MRATPATRGQRTWPLRVLAWLCTFGLYLALAGSVSETELITAAVVGSGTALWSAAIRDRSPIRFVAGAAYLRCWARAVGGLLPAIGRVAATLTRVAMLGGSPALAARWAFDYGALDDAHTRARRATALLAASLGPETFVVRLPQAGGHALAHTLRPRPAPDPQWLI